LPVIEDSKRSIEVQLSRGVHLQKEVDHTPKGDIATDFIAGSVHKQKILQGKSLATLLNRQLRGAEEKGTTLRRALFTNVAPN
jgi:hypothetical protein